MTDRQPSSDDLLALLRQADAVFRDVLRNVAPEQMHLPTINDEWDVRALINHVVLGNTWEAALVRTGDAPHPSGDVIGDRDPLAAYTASAERMLATYAEPGALQRTVKMPEAEVAVAQLAGLRIVDLVSHAWDLAEATGQNTDLTPALSESTLSIARHWLGGWDRARTPFKEEVAVPADAPVADRLAAFLGKHV